MDEQLAQTAHGGAPHCTFHIPALDCPEETALLRRGLRGVAGVVEIRANYAARTLHVQIDPARVDAAQVEAELRRIGFPPCDDHAECIATLPAEARVPWPVIAGGLLLGVGLLIWLTYGPTELLRGVWIASAALSAIPVLVAAWRALRLRTLDMNVLMCVAATGAIAIGEDLEAAAAMFLFGVAIWLESFAVERTRRAIGSLLALAPSVAHRLRLTLAAESLDTEDVHPDTLCPGDRIVVRPGEHVPVDGVVERGASALNQAAITGESLPIEKQPGDTVFAGTLNGEGVLVLRATQSAAESTLSHIARLVQAAEASRSPTERFVDRFARAYTPLVLMAAVAIVVLGPLVLPGAASWVSWLHRGLVALVIACPCALVISTPLSIACGLYQATRLGIFLKGGEHLEAAGRIDCVLLDKTGTVTIGLPQVTAVETAAGVSQSELLSVAAALEQHSEHPLAAAIVGAARDHGLPAAAARDAVAQHGFGISGTIDGETYFVGSPTWFREEQLGGGELDRWSDESQREIVALVGSRRRLLGAIHLSDPVREDSARAIAELRSLGVRNVSLVTGDRTETAERVAEILDARGGTFNELHAGLLPHEKIKIVESLSARYQTAMVGDGVNDAPALAAARLGIALGAAASPTALETADAVIMAPRLSKVVELLRLGQRARTILRQNIILALSVKLVTLALAAAGLATMWMAVAADVGATLLVIFNGMRLIESVPQDES
ncbi:MAG: cation-translocating P-type ATPase [Pirellulales bacterium]